MAQTLTHETSGAVSLQAHGPGFYWAPSGIGYIRMEKGRSRVYGRWELWEVREQRQGKSKHELDCVLRSPGWTDPALGVLRLHSLQWAIIPQLKKEKNQFWVSILDAP